MGEWTDPTPWGGSWPEDGRAIDIPSPVAGAPWPALRATLMALGWQPEPNLHPDHGLIGYAVQARNALLSIGLGQRESGPSVIVSAVLCRGMERPAAALVAVDRANCLLRAGQLLFYPGPPAELAFYAALPWPSAGPDLVAAWLPAVLREAESAGHVAVSLVRGFHPADLTALWQQSPQEAGPADGDGQRDGKEAEPAAAIVAPQRPKRRRRKPPQDGEGET